MDLDPNAGYLDDDTSDEDVGRGRDAEEDKPWSDEDAFERELNSYLDKEVCGCVQWRRDLSFQIHMGFPLSQCYVFRILVTYPSKIWESQIIRHSMPKVFCTTLLGPSQRREAEV